MQEPPPSFPRENLDEDIVLLLMARLNIYDQHLVCAVSRNSNLCVKLARKQMTVEKDILSVSAGKDHTVICTVRGIFSFGNGELGQLGHGDKELAPRLLDGPLAGQVSPPPAAAGNETVDRIVGASSERSSIHEYCPKMIEKSTFRGGSVCSSGIQVLGASAGSSRTLAYTEEGEVYSFYR